LIIAVNTRFLLDEYLEGYGYFLYETMKRITLAHPEHQFLFIFDRPFDKKFLFAENVKGLICSPPARHPLLWKFWYDVKLPSLLKKHKADIFVSTDGFCSLHTSVPQVLVVHDLAFLHYPSFSQRSHLLFYKRYTGRFLEKAKRIATVSKFSKQDILVHYPVTAEKIDIVYTGVKDIFIPLDPGKKEKVKEKYTGGKEYFLYTGSIHPRKNLTNLLKAFSIFKKRQRSSMKLVLAGRLAWKYDRFMKDLGSYKFREDVVLTGYLAENELSGLTGAAYSMVYPSLFEGFGVPVLEAMRSGIPVITSVNSSMQEIAGDAALYADPTEPLSIADQMMLIYKDESMKGALVEKGRLKAQQFSWDNTANLFWATIRRALD
jgi:glycosyltransferase involved in cell wall biosynthesis